MFKNFMALGVSTLVRVLTGFVLFILIAGTWGVALFGHFMYLFSVVSLLVLACEFGFSQQILREVGRTPERAGALMSSYFGAKVWLTAGAFALALVFSVISRFDGVSWLVLLLLLLAAALQSYSDFLLACLRALGRFTHETRVTFLGNVLYFGAATGALYAHGGIVGVSAAMAAARVLHLLITWRAYRCHVAEKLVCDLRPRPAIAVIRRGAAYGIDGAVAQVFMNVDTILINHVLGPAATGLYQAGARFYQGAMLLAPIFGSLFLPRLARAGDDNALFGRQFRQLSLGLIVSGLLLALTFIVGSSVVGIILRHADFERLAVLLPWFGVLIFARYTASIYGTVLTALGGQSVRVLIYIVSLVVMVLAALLLLHRVNVVGMILAVILAHLVLSAGLALWIRRYRLRVQGIWLATTIGSALTAWVYLKTGI